MRTSVIGWVLATGWLLVSCSSAAPDCTRPGDCGSGQGCANGRCFSACSQSFECKSGEACQEGVCRPYQSDCTRKSDCIDTSFYCEAGRCVRTLDLGSGCENDDMCGSAFCSDGVCCNIRCTGTCKGCRLDLTGSPDGRCAALKAGTDPDEECAGGVSCDGVGACGVWPLGHACSQVGECLSSLCIDGVCCESACSGVCQHCLNSATGQPSGVCRPVIAGLDPREDCPGDAVCDANGQCLGRGVGEACAQHHECLSRRCVDRVCCLDACDGPCRACDGLATGLANGVCGSVLLGRDPREGCQGPLACNGTGECFHQENGEACTQGYECKTGLCADRVCCNRVCDGLCESCLGSVSGGSDGECDPVPNNLDPDNECKVGENCDGKLHCTTNRVWGPPTVLGSFVSSERTNPPLLLPSVAIHGGKALAAWMVLTSSGVYEIRQNLYARSTGWVGEAPLVKDSRVVKHTIGTAVDPTGNAWIFWRLQLSPIEQLIRWNVNTGSGWSFAWTVPNTSQDEPGFLDCVFESDGKGLLFWRQFDGFYRNLYAARFDPLKGIGLPSLLNRDNQRDTITLRVGAGAGRVLAVWNQYAEDGSGRIDLWSNQIQTTGAAWGSPLLMENNTQRNSAASSVAINATGRTLATWIRFKTGLLSTAAFSLFVPGSGWTGERSLPQKDVSKNVSDALGGVTPDGSGVVVWNEIEPGQNPNVSRLWASRSPSDSVIWGEPQAVDGGAAKVINGFWFSLDASGVGFLVWTQTESSAQEIWMNLFDPLKGWDAPQKIQSIPSANLPSGDPSVVFRRDAQGNAILVWRQYDADRWNLVGRLVQLP